MTQAVITESIREELKKFLKKHKNADLVTTYLYYMEKRFKIAPVVFLREKKIYKGKDELFAKLESEGKLWRETEIKIQVGQEGVNSETKKIYICPFSGKVFGDNTHPNPQDAIYDWVSVCPENTERVGGLRSKRFFVSEDPEVIKNYMAKEKKSISKTVYSSGVTGKLFNSKQAVIKDFTANQIKPIPLLDVPSQNRFQIEESFLEFIQSELEDSKIGSFVEALSKFDEFALNLEQWMEEENVEEEEPSTQS